MACYNGSLRGEEDILSLLAVDLNGLMDLLELSLVKRGNLCLFLGVWVLISLL